ncbi:lipopolysaccharide biosynthesis protein [Sulfurospirillum arcachonense]|uniref:lipopolysaccharide biosynthesis protein n=1 Tax=Sulfurospirillum arcachonense TaxID=57666 RepID=UPI000468FEFD|nr:polysaccharide biosynthesis C-terminal domain-containing protein [Sulfurospirillum arcachonense]
MIKNHLNRLLKGSFVYGIGGILQKFIGLFLLPFFTSVLTPEEYGVVALIGLLSVGLVSFFNLGTGSSMGILYFQEKDEIKRISVIWSNFLLLSSNTTVMCSIFIFFSQEISTLIFQTHIYSEYINLSIISLGMTVIYNPFLDYLRMEGMAKKYVIITLINTLIAIVFSVVFVLIWKWGLFGFFLASLCSSFVMFLFIYIFIMKKLNFYFNLEFIKPLVKIGFPSIWGLFAFLIIDYADRQMIERFLGLVDLGIYSVGYSFGMMMLILVGAFGSAWPPFFMSFINKKEEAKEVFGYVLNYYLMFFGFIVILFFVVAKPIVVLMTDSKFYDAYTIVGLVALAYMLKGVYLILLPGLYFEKKLKYQSMIEWVAAISNIGFNLWMIPLYGMIGAAYATLISYFILVLLSWYIGQKYLDVNYNWKKIYILILFFSISIYLAYVISMLDNLVVEVFFSALLICFCLFVLYFFLDTEEKNFLKIKLRRRNY